MSSTSSPFGQNEWLVEEMYRKFREDPASVDQSWHEFLAGYSPDAAGDAAAAANGHAKPATPAANPSPAATAPMPAPLPVAMPAPAPPSPRLFPPPL